MSDNKSLGPNGFGGTMSAPVWQRYMLAVLAVDPSGNLIELFQPADRARYSHDVRTRLCELERGRSANAARGASD